MYHKYFRKRLYIIQKLKTITRSGRWKTFSGRKLMLIVSKKTFSVYRPQTSQSYTRETSGHCRKDGRRSSLVKEIILRTRPLFLYFLKEKREKNSLFIRKIKITWLDEFSDLIKKNRLANLNYLSITKLNLYSLLIKITLFQ